MGLDPIHSYYKTQNIPKCNIKRDHEDKLELEGNDLEAGVMATQSLK